MKDRTMKRWSTYEPFFVELGSYKVADIVITRHAKLRWEERISRSGSSIEAICEFMWDKLKAGKIALYHSNEQDVYVIDGDLVMVAEFTELENTIDLVGNPLHKMIIITVLGRISETFELRDIKTYYAWLRHSRRMTLIKNGRKKR